MSFRCHVYKLKSDFQQIALNTNGYKGWKPATDRKDSLMH